MEQRRVHSGLLNHRSQGLWGDRRDRRAQALNLEDSLLMELLSLETWQALRGCSREERWGGGNGSLGAGGFYTPCACLCEVGLPTGGGCGVKMKTLHSFGGILRIRQDPCPHLGGITERRQDQENVVYLGLWG